MPPPEALVPDAALIRCPQCGTVLGARVAGLSVIRRRGGGDWVGVPVSIGCRSAKCSGVWVEDRAELIQAALRAMAA